MEREDIIDLLTNQIQIFDNDFNPESLHQLPTEELLQLFEDTAMEIIKIKETFTREQHLQLRLLDRKAWQLIDENMESFWERKSNKATIPFKTIKDIELTSPVPQVESFQVN